jgi:hypothetical protein
MMRAARRRPRLEVISLRESLPSVVGKKRTVPPSVSTASKMLENVTSPKVAESIEIEKVTGIVSRPAMAVEPPAAFRRVESARECVRVMSMPCLRTWE